MADIQAIRELLASEYGITSTEELRNAMRKMSKLNVGAFVAPTKKNGDERNVYGMSPVAMPPKMSKCATAESCI